MCARLTRKPEGLLHFSTTSVAAQMPLGTASLAAVACSSWAAHAFVPLVPQQTQLLMACLVQQLQTATSGTPCQLLTRGPAQWPGKQPQRQPDSRQRPSSKLSNKRRHMPHNTWMHIKLRRHSTLTMWCAHTTRPEWPEQPTLDSRRSTRNMQASTVLVLLHALVMLLPTQCTSLYGWHQ